ncbi:MAG: MBL fold metallo-hydrolase [Candidatus Thalassarchaeaceae archaeon]|nr:MBL fold metallo-hydrolase [Candidatus Thalassarchaeaceae archaeon]
MTPGGAVLIDCGEGMQKRLLDQNKALKKSGLQIRSRMAKVRAILFTHGHLDHCWGLLPMLHTMSLDGRTEPLTIIAPTSQKAVAWALKNPGDSPPAESGVDSTDLAILFQQWQSLGSKDDDFGFKIDWVLLPIEQHSPFISPIQPLDGVELMVVPTEHGIPSCGWQITTNPAMGKFNRAKADSLSLTTEQVATLAGGEDITTDSETLMAKDFRGEVKPRRSLLISGDTIGGVQAFGELTTPPDLLLHEATFLEYKSEKAKMYNHSTTHDAARHAKVSGCQVLALTHYSSSVDDITVVQNEAQELHKRSIACSDGDVFTISRDGEITVHRRCEAWQNYSL